MFNRKNKLVSKYFIGNEISFTKNLKEFLETQCVDQQTAEESEYYIRLDFKASILASYSIFNGGEVETDSNWLTRLNADSFVGSEFNMEFSEHKHSFLVKTEKGHSFVGGRPVEDLILPVIPKYGVVQYLGFLSNMELGFSWLPESLHIVCPLYHESNKVWMDYSNSKQPEIINSVDIYSIVDSFIPESKIYFKKQCFVFEETKEVNLIRMDTIGNAGIPFWTQYPEIPTCPKTGLTMKFLFSIRHPSIPTDWHNLKDLDDYDKKSFDEMDIWGDGELYIFFEPISKIMCCVFQTT
jgi:hypothetical protein